MKEKVTTADLVHDALARAPESLTMDAIVAHVLAHHPKPPKNPKNTVRSSVSHSPLLVTLPDGRLGYLPRLLTGCCVRQYLSQATLEARRIAMTGEARTALWPALFAHGKRRDDRPIAVQLSDGPTATLTPEAFVGGWSIVGPPEMWRWLEAYYPHPGDELIIRALDVPARQYSLEFAPGTGRDMEIIAVRNKQIADLACQLLQTRRGEAFEWEVFPSLIALGAYRDPVPPDSLASILSEDKRFVHLGMGQILLAERMTPGQWAMAQQAQRLEEILLTRLEAGEVDTNELMRNILEGHADEAMDALQSAGLFDPDMPDDELGEDLWWEEEDLLPPFQEERRGDAALWRTQCYTLKTKINRPGRVSRTIEIRGDQTLQALHRAIQQAYEWGDDHLYSFFMSGEAWDAATEIIDPRGEEGEWFADEVKIGALRLQQGQKFLYLFDFGDEHRFTITVERIGPAAKKTKYPRVVESHGKSPPQYPDYE